MQAIILAAGMGRRLCELTSGNTKCMVAVNGVRLIDRMLMQLATLGLSRIIIVTGYRGDNLRCHIRTTFPHLNVCFIENPVFDRTNNIYSLWLARDMMAQESTLLLESDLVFRPEVLRNLVDSPYPDCALVSKYDTWMDGTMVTVDDENNIVNFIPKKAFDYADTEQYYKTVNIYKFSQNFIVNHYLPFLEAYIRVLGENEYYEQVLRVISLIDGVEFKAVKVDGQSWYEIDDIQDLRIAETIFADPEERLLKLREADGGLWRYPGLLDMAHPGNPFFPKDKIKDEMRANFDRLLTGCPSSEGVMSLIASKCLTLRQEYVAVANDISALIDIAGASRLIHNPGSSGKCLDDAAVVELLASLGKDERVIVDETGLVYSDATSLLTNDILEQHPGLVVVRNLSYDYGVAGLRLAIAASSDTIMVNKMNNECGNHTVNSFAEFFMQIFSKYEKDYSRAVIRFKSERRRLLEELSHSSVVSPLPTQSNFVICKVKSPLTAKSLILRLLTDYNILVGEYDLTHIRVAIGSPEDNSRLLAALV